MSNPRAWIEKNHEKNRLTRLARRIAHIDRIIWRDSKKRAEKYGLDFDLEIEDIVVPEFCPVLGLLLNFSGGQRTDASPSIDRFDNNKGYVKGDIRII